MELLIVIAIIALLAAILFPAFATARESARRSVCLSNLKQMGMAIQQYTQDYDELYPSIGRFSSNVGHFTSGMYSDTWSLSLPYLKNEQIFRCPSDANPPDCTPEYGCMEDGKEISYAFNGGPAFPGFGQKMGGIYSSRPASGPLGTSLAAVTTPSDAFVAADGWDVAWHFMAPDAYSLSTMPSKLSSWRHRGWRNCLFADGHVKAVKFRVGRTSSLDAVLLPADKSYYGSYCVNPDVMVAYGGDKRCGDVAALYESSVSSWLPD